jgi:hypothetical protein
MKRHRFNIFPEAKAEDYQRLKQDIEANGYDEKQPIMLYQGDILDGWNRQKACDELGIAARYQHFVGNDTEAIAYMMRTNKRRNLNSGQWATIAVEAEELVAAIRDAVEKEGLTKRTGRPKKEITAQKAAQAVGEDWPCHHCGGSHPIGKNPCHGWKEGEPSAAIEKSSQKIDETSGNEKRSDHKAAKLFNTNRTYVNQAAKLKAEAPEVFEQVKAGTMRMTDAAKAVKAIPKDDWRPDERERQSLCKGGQSVVANASKDQNLIKWAESEGKAVRIDRGTKYGNPFLLDSDGDRDQVCNCYERHYLPHKPSINSDIGKLKGKVLVCHCYPLRCHGDTLASKANEI